MFSPIKYCINYKPHISTSAFNSINGRLCKCQLKQIFNHTNNTYTTKWQKNTFIVQDSYKLCRQSLQRTHVHKTGNNFLIGS